jgi:hypothetical protein
VQAEQARDTDQLKQRHDNYVHALKAEVSAKLPSKLVVRPKRAITVNLLHIKDRLSQQCPPHFAFPWPPVLFKGSPPPEA